MINFRTGTHNPLTLYVASEPYGKHEGRDLPGWMRDGEWSIGWLPHEGLAALAVEAWNAFVCVACPWGCPSCSLNRATCECYEHQDRIDEDGRPVEGSTPLDSPPPDMRSRRQGGRGAVAQAGEPAPVPPPVDALLNRITAWGSWMADIAHYKAIDATGDPLDRASRNAVSEHAAIVEELNALHAAGVEEGRRQGVRRLAQGTDEWATYIREQAYERGVAEGRRQATEERTEDERQHRGDVTEKGCLGVGPGHGLGRPHFWRCSTPGCMGHLCRTEAVDHG